MNVFLVNPVIGVDHMLTTALTDLFRLGGTIQNQRTGSEIKEILGYVFNSVTPQDRIIRNPNRKNNLIAQIAETAWVMAGSNDLSYINPFLPRAVDFSDDGRTWRAGYGPRIAGLTYTPPEGFLVTKRDNFFVESKSAKIQVNQLENVINILREDPSSRQAFMIVPLPGDNLVSNNTVDTPCTLSIQFLVRDSKLHCFVDMRSNDVVWGTTGINYFEWTFIQEIVASILGYKIGIYTHKANSLHIYSRHYEMSEKILKPYFDEEFDITEHLALNLDSYEEVKLELRHYFHLFDEIQRAESPDEELWTNIRSGMGRNSLGIYLSAPLFQLYFKKFDMTSEQLKQIIALYSPYKYLYAGLLKAGKFFLDNKLNNKSK